jgi:hypothetical protein
VTAKRFGDLYGSYYVCESCGARVPAQKIERACFGTGPNGEEVPVVTRPWAVFCTNHPSAWMMRRVSVNPQTAD